MAVSATINVESFHTNVVAARTAISPPLSGTKKTNDGRASGNRQMRRSGVATDIHARTLGQFVKPFQRKADSMGLARMRSLYDCFCELSFARAVSN